LQNLISKIFIFLTLFTHTLFGCALCTIYSPETKVSIKVQADEHKIKTVEITWVLSKEFTNMLKEVYDTNQNNYLDKNELIPVEQSLLDYIVPRNYLTHISYDKIINKEKSLKADVIKKKSYIKNSLLHFNYVLNLDYDLDKEKILYLNIDDKENYFILLLVKNSVKIDAPFEIKQIVDRKSVVFYLDGVLKDEKLQEDEPKEQEVIESNIDETKKLEKLDESKQQKEETYLAKFSNKVKEYLIKIENGDNYALFILLGISFLYGIIHALGPGHGKSLAFSYFVANKSSFTKAFFISQASAFIHIVGALVLVIVSVFILQSVLNNFVNDSVEILTKISAFMIMALAAFILYNKIVKKSCACSSCCSASASQTNSIWSTTKPKNTTKLKANFMKKDLYFVLTAGLIPCPGTVILFIYAFMLKTYFAVILASIFISLGMGLVIFASSFLGVSVQKVSEKSHKLTNFLEYLSPVVMFLLGVLLFLNAQMV
jgi:ABC-type nickel/cobalt efflux system permease component RcnA